MDIEEFGNIAPEEMFSQALHDSVQDEIHGNALPCGCVPHKTRPNDLWGGIYCDTEQQGYCNFECPHEDGN